MKTLINKGKRSYIITYQGKQKNFLPEEILNISDEEAKNLLVFKDIVCLENKKQPEERVVNNVKKILEDNNIKEEEKEEVVEIKKSRRRK